MLFSSLRLHNFRSYKVFETALSPDLTVIVGPNGSGKTNILEALYVMAVGSSFRGRDRDMIRYGQSSGSIKTTSEGASRSITLSLSPDGKFARQFVLQGQKRQRLSFSQRLPVVLFDPESLRMLSSSPARRRDFLDTTIGRLEPQYATMLHRFERSLLQRNELLKQIAHGASESWHDQLFVWDVKLAELAEYIIERRLDFIAECNRQLSTVYSMLSDQKSEVVCRYKGLEHPPARYRQTLFSRLQASILVDSSRGYTSVGPHRDDFVMELGGHPVSEMASRGEMRTLMLAFKLIEVGLMRERHDTAPLLLLDDVFSELDIVRRQKLMATIKNSQTIITTTDADMLGDTLSYQLIKTSR